MVTEEDFKYWGSDASACGVSVVRDLAIITAVRSVNCGITLAGMQMFTPSDGRAFRNCPYWSRWRGTDEFILHDAGVDEFNFGRALREFCAQHNSYVIGFDSGQTPVAHPRAIPIAKESPHVGRALEILNACDREYQGGLFPTGSGREYMWCSLPMLQGKRVLPTKKLLATGRYDCINALIYAIGAWLTFDAEFWAEKRKRTDAQCRAVEAAWEAIPADTLVWVIVFSPNRTRKLLKMSEALPLLKSRTAVFEGLGEQ